MAQHGEIRRPAFADRPVPTISFGVPFPETCKKHAEYTFQAQRVYIIASRTLSTQTDALKRLEGALGDRVVGKRVGMTPHTLWSECLQVAADCRKLSVDLIVTLGAGSLTDAAKIVSLALANDATTFEDLVALQGGRDPAGKQDGVRTAQVPIISIPTTLSGGEYQDLAGATNDDERVKYGFKYGTRGPVLVVLDAALTTTTPNKFWISTGVRAIDHCVETLCSLASHDESDRAAARGLQTLVPGLLRCKRNGPRDLEARHMCQVGAIGAMTAVGRHDVQLGASHGIGHQLGPLGVSHGETSCILLPAVCWYNRPTNKDRQQVVEQILWLDPVVADVMRERGLAPDSAELDDMLDAIISELGMPRSLRAVGVSFDQLDRLAENALVDKWCQTNPIPLTKKEQVWEILEMVIE